MSFAEGQLRKYGWSSGQGLGKNGDGIKRPIKPIKKDDTKGLGAGKEQFEFAWWDHLYNKSANAVVIDKNGDGEVNVRITKDTSHRRSKTGIISTEPPSGQAVSDSTEASIIAIKTETQKTASSILYGMFVKGTNSGLNLDGTLGRTKSDIKEKDDVLKDYSLKVTDAELFTACEGRTAHKGARGDQIGKYARVMNEFLAARPHESAKESKDNHVWSEKVTDGKLVTEIAKDSKKLKNVKKRTERAAERHMVKRRKKNKSQHKEDIC